MNATDDIYRPCPCGSGAKYRFCCFQTDHERRRDLLREARHIRGPDGGPTVFLDLEEAESAHRLGLALVERMQAREAIPVLERAIKLAPVVPQPHNNLAMAHFLEGDPERALEICDRVDRVIDPGNVFALGNRIHFLLVLGRRLDAEKVGQRILDLPGRDAFAVYKKCEALARLRWHDHVHHTAKLGLPRAGECAEGLKFFAGTAAANLAHRDVAERYLREARNDRVHGRMARRHLGLLRSRGGPGTLFEDWPYLEWEHWTSPGLLERMKAGQEEAQKFPGMIEAMVCLLNEGGEDESPIRMLGLIGTPEAFEVLRRIASGTFGSDQLRLMALSELQDGGQVGQEETLDMWVKGRRQTVRARRLEVTTEIPPSLPEDLRDPMAHVVDALHSGDWRRAETLGREIVSRGPTCPQALHNLAMALLGQGHEGDAEGMLRRAIAVDPGYLFAPASLARLLSKQGRRAEARAILDGVRLPDKVHPDGYAMFLLARAEVSLLDGDFDAAATAWGAADEIAPHHPAVRQVSRGWVHRVIKGIASARVRD